MVWPYTYQCNHKPFRVQRQL